MKHSVGDPVAGFDRVYRAERDGLVRLAFLLSGSMTTAEDVVQSVFADAHQRWETIEVPNLYLRRAVSNRVRDVQRRDYRWRGLGRARERITGIPEIDTTWDFVSALPAPQRHVIVLRYYEDLSFDQIAELLDRPVATVRSDHRRALQRLRRTLS